MKYIFWRKGEGDFFDSTEVGGSYYYPSKDGVALIVQVMGKTEGSLVIRVGDFKVYIARGDWNQWAIPYNRRIKVVDCLQDPDNDMVFVRYKFIDSIIDRVYNWYVSKIKNPL